MKNKKLWHIKLHHEQMRILRAKVRLKRMKVERGQTSEPVPWYESMAKIQAMMDSTMQPRRPENHFIKWQQGNHFETMTVQRFPIVQDENGPLTVDWTAELP